MIVYTGVDDEFFWIKNVVEQLIVKSCYLIVSQPNESLLWTSDIRKPLGFMWDIKVPSRIHMFGWRLLINRLLTHDQLATRGVVSLARDKCYIFSVLVYCQGKFGRLSDLSW